MRGIQKGIARARVLGLQVVEPKPNEIQLDLDSVRAVRQFTSQLQQLEYAGLTRGWSYQMMPSRARNHMHVVIALPRPVPLRTRVLLAALLGSDLKREMFNYIRVLTRRRYPVVLFRPKEK